MTSSSTGDTPVAGEARGVQDAVATARRFVRERYPRSRVAFLGGSAASGRATRSSDLDIFVLVEDCGPDLSYAETSVLRGWLVEAFVHCEAAAQQ